jgi:hypothetical protein
VLVQGPQFIFHQERLSGVGKSASLRALGDVYGVCGVCGVFPRPYSGASPPWQGANPAASSRNRTRKTPQTRCPGALFIGATPSASLSAYLTLIGVPWSPPRSWLHTALAESCWRDSRLASHALIRSSAYFAVRAGGPVAALQTYTPRCLADLSRFLPDRHTRRLFPKSPRESPAPKPFRVCRRVWRQWRLTPGLQEATAFGGALPCEADLRRVEWVCSRASREN